jgi:cobyric acid synthase CobQ
LTFKAFVSKHSDCIFVVDEAFIEFTDDSGELLKDISENVIVLRSLTKFYAIPGLRLGFAAASESNAGRLQRELPPWSVNSLAQAVGCAMLKEPEYSWETKAYVREQREFLTEELNKIPALKVFPGNANFLLVKINNTSVNASTLAERLLKKRIAIRNCENYAGLDNRFFRVAVRTLSDNQMLIDALADVFQSGKSLSIRRKKTPALMLQGTSSNAGKSVLTAALGRIMLQDGIRVAPFKAQNMSLNSFVTRDGLEMGRAQVNQAQACKLEPDVRMNPVLLKPCTDVGCQVIVEGRPVSNMNVYGYIDYKKEVVHAVHRCYDSLASEYDAIVLEGAGSPGEVNLRKHDIVNMPMARYAQSPVLLVGDIDRGGVFASFIGTMDVMLAQWERDLLAGFVINRFRGDATLLDDAIQTTESYTGKPTFGIVPYIHNLGLPEEDGVDFKESGLADAPPETEHIEIAIIELPHISNFTDIDAFRDEPDTYMRVVRSASELGTPDVVIIPGSKNVIQDLNVIRGAGLADAIVRLAESGKSEVVGICGGFQMLGREICDPLHIESDALKTDGMKLLDIVTELAPEKTLTRNSAIHCESGHEVIGYEIHHGVTSGSAEVCFTSDGAPNGFTSSDGMIWGTYLHGVFDADEFRRCFIDRARIRKGMKPLKSVQSIYNIETAIDRLADTVREGLDMDAIYKVMGI